MGKVVLVEGYWPSTKTKFLQAFEDYDAAVAKYNELKLDSGVAVQITKTEIESVDQLGKMIMSEVGELEEK